MEDLKQIQEFFSKPLEEMMSLDDEAKAYYLAKVKSGEIDTLPEDPKAAFLAQMTKDQMAHDKETLRRERGLEEGKQLDIVDFAKVVQAVTKTGHPVTVLLTPKFNEIEVLTGMDAPDDMLRDLSNAIDSLGYGRNEIIIAGDSSNLSRREYSDIRRVNGGHKDYYQESVNEAEFTDYSNNELAAYLKNNPTDKKAAKELHKRSQALKGLSRTDVNEQADHVAPMVVKAYKEYLEAKKEGNGEKAYRYYSKKLNNTYSTRADRDAIEAILKKKYGSALEEASKEEMDKFAKFQKDLQKTMSTQGWKDLEDRAKEERKEREARKSKSIGEIKGFEEFKETGFKLGDKVKFMGSAHPTHTKPIKLTGTIEYFEPADEIGIRVDGYGAFIPFFKVQSNIEPLNEGGIEDIQKKLDALGVKYEMSKTDKVRPFKVIYKPVNKSDEFYDKFEDIVDLANLRGVVKTSMNEGAEEIMDAYNDVLDLVKKHSRNLSDDDSYAFGLKLKAWFNKNILSEERKLTFNDFVRMVRDDMMAGAAPDERPSEELVGKRAKAYYNEYLQGASVDDIFEAETNVSDDIPDIIAVDVPLFIRLLEFAREDAGDDMDLHEVAERAIEAVKARGVLSMDDYDTLVPPKENLDEKLLVTKSKIDKLARQIAAQISKQKNTRDAQEFLRKAIEDAYAKVFDSDEYEIKEEEGYSKYLKDDPEFPGGKTKGLTPDVMNKILMKIVQDIDETKQLGEGVIEEELCPKGKAYIKKRMAAGEKSSAYLSGRAVKVCKGQMKG